MNKNVQIKGIPKQPEYYSLIEASVEVSETLAVLPSSGSTAAGDDMQSCVLVNTVVTPKSLWRFVALAADNVLKSSLWFHQRCTEKSPDVWKTARSPLAGTAWPSAAWLCGASVPLSRLDISSQH